MAKKKKHPRNFSPRIENRRARFDYDITDTLECGVKLMGSEVKSIRHGHVSLAEGYVAINPNNMGMDLINVDIGPYAQAGVHQHQPKRIRQLLAHKREVKVLYGKTTAKGVCTTSAATSKKPKPTATSAAPWPAKSADAVTAPTALRRWPRTRQRSAG